MLSIYISSLLIFFYFFLKFYHSSKGILWAVKIGYSHWHRLYKEKTLYVHESVSFRKKLKVLTKKLLKEDRDILHQQNSGRINRASCSLPRKILKGHSPWWYNSRKYLFFDKYDNRSRFAPFQSSIGSYRQRLATSMLGSTSVFLLTAIGHLFFVASHTRLSRRLQRLFGAYMSCYLSCKR